MDEWTAFRSDFPMLNTKIRGIPLVWLDNAATTQKPDCVLEEMNRMYCGYNANVHRSAHTPGRQATRKFEDARRTVARFLHADAEEIVFTRGATEAVNLVATSLGSTFKAGERILVTRLEHHSNFVPWQQLCLNRGMHLDITPMDGGGYIDPQRFRDLLTVNTRLAAVTHVSNVLGTLQPVKQIIAMAHQLGIPVLVDGAQAVAHHPVDVADLDADFYCFSGHKVYGPTGSGVLYGKRALLHAMPPCQFGGEMVETVEDRETTFSQAPAKFEAGTPDYVAAVGLARALDYISGLGMKRITAHERELTEYCRDGLLRIPGLRLYAYDGHGILTMTADGAHPEDMAALLDTMGIAVRAGSHCAQPLHRALGVEATLRVSLALYNTEAEMDALIRGIGKSVDILRRNRR